QARAQEFGELASQAAVVDRIDVVPELLWAVTASCSQAQDDLSRRQCEGVRAARAATIAGKAYLMRAEAGSFEATEWDPAESAQRFVVKGCLSCRAAVAISGEQRYLTTGSAVAVEGGALAGPELFRGARRFADENEARQWVENIVPRLRTELLFRVPLSIGSWSAGAVQGYAVDLVGFRVFDPCDGSIIAAEPASAAVTARAGGGCGDDRPGMAGRTTGTDGTIAAAGTAGARGAGGGEDGAASGTGGQDAQDARDAADEAASNLPERLASWQIAGSLQTARAEVNACHARFGVSGLAKLTIEIASDGKVRNVTVGGDFRNTPTGDCIARAVKEAQFPAFKTPSMTIRDFPFILR
ncbi:MAG: hypothetical protein V2A73_12055, partial [Pseudomonadota bacterium]